MIVKNSKGITLVEVLAVLLLIAIVSTTIVSMILLTNRYQITETKKMKMQQEANYIISEILQKHRFVDECYELNITEQGRKLIFKDCGGSMVVISDIYKYSLTDLPSNKIYPKKQDLVTTLTVTDPEDSDLYVAVDTVFSRYKSN